MFSQFSFDLCQSDQISLIDILLYVFHVYISANWLITNVISSTYFDYIVENRQKHNGRRVEPNYLKIYRNNRQHLWHFLHERERKEKRKKKKLETNAAIWRNWFRFVCLFVRLLCGISNVVLHLAMLRLSPLEATNMDIHSFISFHPFNFGVSKQLKVHIHFVYKYILDMRFVTHKQLPIIMCAFLWLTNESLESDSKCVISQFVETFPSFFLLLLISLTNAETDTENLREKKFRLTFWNPTFYNWQQKFEYGWLLNFFRFLQSGAL